jgi:hypothetical protein
MVRTHQAGAAGTRDHSRMRRVGLIAMLLASAMAGAGVAGICDGDRSDYAAENEAVLKTLPVYPGAHEAHRYLEAKTAGYCDSGKGPECETGGWATHVRYDLPDGATGADVLSFYRAQLPDGWEIAVEPVRMVSATPRGEPTATPVETGDYGISLTSGLIEVHISTCASASCDAGTYEVIVDHRGLAY